MINAVYQHCLYIKKLDDMNKDELSNEMDESILTDLWKHMEDTMGGRSFDVHITRLTHFSYFLALFAIIISILSITLSFIV